MYFADEVGQGGLYRAGRATCFLGEIAEFADRLSAAVQALPVDVYDPLPTTQIAPLPVTQPLLSGLVRVQGKEVPKTRLYADYSTLKGAFRQLWRAERDDQQAEDRVSWLRQQLHTAYLHFVSRYGRLTRNRAINWPETVDAQLATVQALETITRQPVPGNRTRVVIGEATILRHRVYPRYSPPTQADTLPDAVALCRARYGQVSPRRVAGLLSKATEQTVLADLLREQFVFIDPQTDQPVEA